MVKARRANIGKFFLCLTCKVEYTEGEKIWGPCTKYKFCPYCGSEIDTSLTPKQAEHLRRKALKAKCAQLCWEDKLKNQYHLQMKLPGETRWKATCLSYYAELGIVEVLRRFKQECSEMPGSYYGEHSQYGLFKDRKLLYTYQKDA